MTYDIVYSCGHVASISLDSDLTEREVKRKIRWLESNGLCKECFKAAKKQERESEPLQLIIAVDTRSMLTPYLLMFGGYTSPHKEDIKKLGFKWTLLGEEFIQEHGLHYNSNVWARRFEYVADLEQGIAEVKRVWGEIPVIDRANSEALKEVQAYKESTKVRNKMIADLVDAIPKPACPPLVASRSWNYKIYGNARFGYYIFLDGEKTTISASDAQMLTAYIGEHTLYEEKVAAIKYRDRK